MGSFTRRLLRKELDYTEFTLTDEAIGDHRHVLAADRKFSLRQLDAGEADGTEVQFRRSVYRIGHLRVKREQVDAWMVRIGPRGRQAVRLCFYGVHQPDGTVPSAAWRSGRP